MIKSLKIRLLPTPDQEQHFWQHIGASRWIWNHMLALQQERHESGEKHLSHFDMNKAITPLKKEEETAWLNDVSNHMLQRTCGDLAQAYNRFFSKQNGFPKFKSRKHSKPNFPLCGSVGKVWFSESVVNIPTVGKVSYKTNYAVPLGNKQKFSNPRISFVHDKWILSVGIEFERQEHQLTDKAMGIDLGVKDLAVVAFGDEQFVFHNINKSRRMRTLEKRKKSLQRTVARKYDQNGTWEKTNNILKVEKKIADISARQSNIRRNYIHKTTHTLTEMLPHTITMEDLNISGMMKNRHLSRAIGEQCLYEVIRQMKYKSEWNGIEFVQANRWFPSSKTCSHCGFINKKLKLKDRTYVCPECGHTIDRDYNAAINLMRYADPLTRAAA